MIRRFNKSNVVSVVLPLMVSSLLVSCGDSDLKTLQIEEIENAQAQHDGIPDSGQALPGGTEVDSLLENATLVFADEFDSGDLDASLWNTAMPWGPSQRVNEELQYYIDTINTENFGYDPFAFDSENLVIRADSTPAGLLESAAQQSYLSGVLTTENKFSFTYGYAEIRAKLPAGKGLWPGFWLLGENYVDRKPQLFVMEGRGDNTSVVYHRYNFNDDDNVFQYSDLLLSSVDDFSDDFHTYGVNWQPGSLTFYVDGVRKQTLINEGVSAQDMYLILTLAVGGWFAEEPDQTTLFPAELLIDHVRVYTLADN